MLSSIPAFSQKEKGAGGDLGAQPAPRGGWGACRLRGLFGPLTLFTLFASHIKFLILSFDALGAARGPLLSDQQKVGKDWPKRAAPPFGIPPLRSPLECLRHNPREEACRTPRRFAAGASAQDLRRLSPPCPHVPQRGKPTVHARSEAAHRTKLKVKQKRKSQAKDCRFMRANAHGTASNAALRQRLRKSSAEAPAAKRRGVPPFPRANCGRRPRQRDRRGIPKGEPLWAALLPTFLQKQKSRGPRAA